MIKKIFIGIGVIIIALVASFYYLAQNAGSMVKAAIENHGSRATQVDVLVDNVEVTLGDKKAGVHGLTIGNPAGFNTERAISLGEVSVQLGDDWSPDLIVIEQVMVDAPEVTYEIGTGGSNIAKIQENVDNFVKALTGGDEGRSDSGSSSESVATSEEEEEGPKVVINNFYIKNGKVNVSATMFGGKTLTTPLPDIHLKDIGKDDEGDGASPAEVVEELISAITDKAGSAAGSLDLSQLGLADISGKAAEIGKAAQDAAEGALKGATENLGDAGGAVGKKIDGAGDAIGGAVKGLFGK
ncbi:MAG: hypothetical protein OQK24_06175 [Magnetovibrio sp.]|nr:hypothetical protein [Magnetovibrio sp.]